MTRRTPITTRNINHLTSDELLSARLCDIKITVEQSEVFSLIKQLFVELQAKELSFRPHFWSSDQWFSPEEVPGVAVPFYLLHERLKKLVRSKIYQVEGADKESCLKILRHEVGHAYDTAYGLSSRPKFKKIFGNPARPYPTSYVPRPHSRNYVNHLELWYAQAHPLEDFAETFAVWLRPRSAWRTRYKATGALKKLEYVDRLMTELRGKKPIKSSRVKVEPISSFKLTLSDYLDRQMKELGIGRPSLADAELLALFSPPSDSSRSSTRASAFLRKHRRTIRRTVSKWTGEHRYKVDLALEEIIERSAELKLKAYGREADLLLSTISMFSVHILKNVLNGNHRIHV